MLFLLVKSWTGRMDSEEGSGNNDDEEAEKVANRKMKTQSALQRKQTAVTSGEKKRSAPPPPYRQAAAALWKCFVYIFHALYLLNKSIRMGGGKAVSFNLRSMCARRSAATEIKRRKNFPHPTPVLPFVLFIFVCSCRSYLFAALSKSVNFLPTK